MNHKTHSQPRRFRIFPLLLGLLLALGCGIDFGAGNGDGPGPVQPSDPSIPSTITTYAGLGSFWTYARSKSDFRITMQQSAATSVLGTVEGIWQKQASGFVKLIMKSGTGRFADVDFGLVAYGLEIPGFLFVLKVPDEEKLIYMPVLGACPTGIVKTNGLVMQPGNMLWNQGLYNHGEVVINMDTGTGTADPREFGVSAGLPNKELQSFRTRCEKGKLTVTSQGNITGDGVLTASGVGVVDDNGGTLLMPQDKDVRLQDISGQFTGLVYSNAAKNELIEPVTLNLSRAQGTVQILADVEGAGTISDQGFPIVFGNMPAGSLPGGFWYSLTGNLNQKNRGFGSMFVVRNIGGSGKMFMAGVGQEPGGTRPYFVFAVSQ